MAKIEWYDEFIDLKHQPKKDEIVVLYYYEPDEGISKKEAVGRVASESSVGTWTTLAKLPKRVQKLKALGYRMKGNYAWVSYPADLWEPGSVPQLMSGIGGNIYGMKAVKNLRMLDVHFPKSYLRNFKGPEFGINGIRKIMKRKKGPLTATVPKPKIGFSSLEHAQVGYEVWRGGIDLIKDDENLTSLKFNKFEDRIKLMSRYRDKAEMETGDKKSALLNITGETKEMIKRARLLYEYGWEYAMVDVVTAGFAGVQTIRDECHDLKLAIHAHRAMHAMFDKNPKHGMTMLALAKLMRLIGVDQIHTGTAVGKLVGTKSEIKNIVDEMRERKIKERNTELLDQDWDNIKPVLPVSSGGLHPGIVPDIIKMFGTDLVIQGGGGVLGHPKGAYSGAKAFTQAINAAMKHITLEEYAKKHPELSDALKKWGRIKPR
ncbi:type III ribulose-bisphosphate carboxylase [Candidatus Micrarchaeota archaeon]|nr:type III ribulose-bisphosphate carboxylase [Candidatus Micrarchaeota archaeon]